MLRIGICDDVEETVAYHADQIRKIMLQMGINADIRKCYTGSELLMEIEENGKFHIILLDIEMDRLNGIETARRIRSQDPYVVLIFVSAYDQYCKEAISVQPYAYLDKPVTLSQMKEVVKEAYNRQIEESENFDFRMNKVYYTLSLSTIYYFKSELRKIYIISAGRESWFYGKLDHVEEQLREKRHIFLRIHKSYLVNIRYISSYSYEKIILQNGDELEISKANRSKIRKFYIEQIDK